MLIGKVITVIFWLAALFNLIIPFSDPLGTVLFWMLIAICVIHAVELMFFKKRLAAMGYDLSGSDQLKIFIFGGFHLMVLMKSGRFNLSGDSNRA